MIHATQKQIIEAYNAMDRICRMALYMRDAKHIANLYEVLKPIAQNHDKKIYELFDKYAPGGENGMYVFPSPEAEESFNKESEKFESSEIDIDADTVEIKLLKYGECDLAITPYEAIALKGFVAFVDNDTPS